MRKVGPTVFLVILLGLVALLIFAPWRSEVYDRSVLGSKGLEFWLAQKGIPVVRSDEHISRNRSELSLRILPLRAPPQNSNGKESSEDQIESWVLEEKIYELSTLVIFPKWRETLIKDGIAKGNELLSTDTALATLTALGFADLRLLQPYSGFEEADLSLTGGKTHRVKLYQAQVFDRAKMPKGCKELAGFSEGALLLQCEHYNPTYLLSDPDLMNNHGLTQGDNADFAVTLVKNLRGENAVKPVYLDTDTRLLEETEQEEEGRRYERSATDFARFFDYPLSIIWGAILFVTVISFWRGAYRFGPPVREGDERIEISKTVAIAAMARLLRLSGNDGRMAAQFVQHLLADKAALVFGPAAANAAGIERLYQRLARRDEALSAQLRTTAQALIERGSQMSRSELYSYLETFRKLLRSADLGS
ncbi:hypothetical protein AAIB41_12660 [Brucella sp. BE17]|uniref:hypothetical protein n=1 Tax=Brucella sp. BE17 TaxID=3142977 RepID=UPI0031B9D576